MKIIHASTSAQLQDLYGFRYGIYVEEMNRPQKYADHDNRSINDTLDETAYNLIALDHAGLVVGCVRINMCRDGGMDNYGPLCRMQDVGLDHPRGTSLCTRLMVAARYRKSPLAVQLATASYELGLEHGINWNFVDCNDHLVSFFDRLGYEMTHRAHHDEYGEVNVMRLNLNDADRLTEKRSVFLKSLRHFQQSRDRRELVMRGEYV